MWNKDKGYNNTGLYLNSKIIPKSRANRTGSSLTKYSKGGGL